MAKNGQNPQCSAAFGEFLRHFGPGLAVVERLVARMGPLQQQEFYQAVADELARTSDLYRRKAESIRERGEESPEEIVRRELRLSGAVRLGCCPD